MAEVEIPESALGLALSAGPLTTLELAAKLAISPTALARRIKAEAAQLCKFGTGKDTRYALRRSLAGYQQFQLYRISTQGSVEEGPLLELVAPRGFVYKQTKSYLPGLRWDWQDLRPQGYLGQRFARQMAERYGLPPQAEQWQDDQILLALQESGMESCGNLLVGDKARKQWLARKASNNLKQRYPKLAQQIRDGEYGECLLAGEQAKFAATIKNGQNRQAVIVKFTPPDDPAQRWRDLLACEHLALQCLQAACIAAAQSRILDFGGQRFLEVQRFDRNAQNGALGLVSLPALAGEYAARSADWPLVTRTLLERGLISPQAHANVCQLYVFGLMIGNEDMLAANLSFILGAEAPYELAPAYDMLPSMLTPRKNGAIPDTRQLYRLSLWNYPEAAVWQAMLPLAIDYWQQVLHSPLLSADFLPLAQAMLQRVEQLQAQLARV